MPQVPGRGKAGEVAIRPATMKLLLYREHDRLNAQRVVAAEPMPRFGAWQAIRLLGRGGMGTVYLAERADGAFRMQAAVKVQCRWRSHPSKSKSASFVSGSF